MAGSTLTPDSPEKSSEQSLSRPSAEQLQRVQQLKALRGQEEHAPQTPSTPRFDVETPPYDDSYAGAYNTLGKQMAGTADGIATRKNAAAPAAETETGKTPSTPEANDDTDKSWDEGGTFKRKPGESNRQYALRWAGQHKKALGIGGALAGGSVGAIIFGFLTLVPMRVEFLVNSIQSKFGAGANSALSNVTNKLMDQYLTKYVMPGLTTGKCTTTVSANCVANIEGKSPVARLYQAWRQQKMENALAKRGLTFERTADGKLLMNMKGTVVLNDTEMRAAIKDGSIFEKLNSVGQAEVSAKEALQAVHEATADETLFLRMYHRFIYGTFLKYKYGVTKRCLIVCQVNKKIDLTVKEQLQVGKAFLLRAFAGDQRALMVLCAADTKTLEACKDALQKKDPVNDPAEAAKISSRDAPETGFTESLVKQYAATATEEDAAKLIAQATAIQEGGGLTRTLVKDIGTRLLGEFGGKLASDAIPGFGWVQLGATLVDAAGSIGIALQHMSYAVNIYQAVQTFSTFSIAASEFQTGKSTPAIQGSLNAILNTNLLGTNTGQADATDSPMYSYLLSGNTSTYNAATTQYRCNDGSKVPTGKLVCPEEELDHGNDAANTVHNALSAVPGLTQLASFINHNPITDLFNALIGKYLDLTCSVENFLPPQGQCDKSQQASQEAMSKFSDWLMNLLISPFIPDNPSGARIFDAMAAGSDAAENKTCQTQLGCAKLTDQQVADIRNQQTAQEKASFDSRPLFARIFSTDTQYSLAAHMAMAMPATFSGLTTDMATLISNPFSTIGSMFANIFGGSQAFAATPAQPDPFGIIQYGYTSIPNDPEGYYEKNCQGDFSTKWENENSENQDPATGEAVALHTEPCLLIESAVESAGGLADPSLLPQDSLNPDRGAETVTSSVTQSNTFWLPSGGGAQFAGLGDNQYDSTSKVSLPWISGQCSQASLAEVLNAYHQGTNAAVKNSGAAPPTKSGYYRIIDTERQSYALGVWPGYFTEPSTGGGFKASWDLIANHFNMNDDYTQFAAHEKDAARETELGKLITEAKGGKPVITTAPNHWLVIIGGDSNYVDLLDSSPWNDTWAEAVSNDGSETITRAPVHDAGIKQYGTPTRVLRSTFLHGLSQYADYWGGDPNGDAGSSAPIAVVLTPKN